MLKRTKGYILLTMLVLTGLAGRIHTDTLRGKERTLLVNEIKTNKASFLSEINGLSRKQLNYQVKGQSIRNIIHEELCYESNIWNSCKMQVSKQEVILTNNHAVTDNEFSELLKTGCIEFNLPTTNYKPNKATKEEIAALKKLKDEELKFARTTTDNLHRYTLQTNYGTLDIYQVMLLTSAYSNNRIQQIKSLKSSAGFPK